MTQGTCITLHEKRILHIDIPTGLFACIIVCVSVLECWFVGLVVPEGLSSCCLFACLLFCLLATA